MNPLLRAENRVDLMRKCMISIDTLQNKVIEKANKKITNLTEFENAARQKLEACKVKIS